MARGASIIPIIRKQSREREKESKCSGRVAPCVDDQCARVRTVFAYNEQLSMCANAPTCSCCAVAVVYVCAQAPHPDGAPESTAYSCTYVADGAYTQAIGTGGACDVVNYMHARDTRECHMLNELYLCRDIDGKCSMTIIPYIFIPADFRTNLFI